MNYEGNHNLNKVTGLWKHTDSNGNTYFKGNISMGCSVVIVPQGGKKEDNRYIPDYVLCFGPNAEEQCISEERWDYEEHGDQDEIVVDENVGF